MHCLCPICFELDDLLLRVVFLEGGKGGGVLD